VAQRRRSARGGYGPTGSGEQREGGGDGGRGTEEEGQKGPSPTAEW
jgi:hypothetical protein